MSVVLSEKRGLRALHPEQWVFSLDRWLRRWHGVYEFTAHRECLFRAERCLAEESLLLSDGVRVRRGDPLLKVHLWNEHMPLMGQDGPTVAWARRTSRAIETSLRELARHVAQCSDLDAVVAVCADMRLATARRSAQLARIVSRYGFEPAAKDSRVGRPGLMRLIGENILMGLLVLATNPIAFRAAILRRDHVRVIISPAKLLRLYRL
ncbi:MAG: YkoP family protein [Steroidobacteraceae bacterium]